MTANTRSERTSTTAQAEAAEQRTVTELLSRGLIAGLYPRNYVALDVYAFRDGKDRRVGLQVKYVHSADTGSVFVRTMEGVDFS